MSQNLYVVEFSVYPKEGKSFDATAHAIASSAEEAARIHSAQDGVEFDVERVTLVDREVYDVDENGAMHRL